MSLTKNFKETVAKRVAKDAQFRHAMLLDAINELLNDNLQVAKLLVRDYVNESPLFDVLARPVTLSFLVEYFVSP